MDPEQPSEKEERQWHCPFSIGRRMQPRLGFHLRNGWWILPLLSLLGFIDLVIAVLNFKPGLPLAFELLSFVLLFVMMRPVFHAFCWRSCSCWIANQTLLLMGWCLSMPLNLAAVVKSIAALILQSQNRLPVTLNYVSIALAMVLFFYDVAISFYDFSAKFGREVYVPFPGWDTHFRQEALRRFVRTSAASKITSLALLW